MQVQPLGEVLEPLSQALGEVLEPLSRALGEGPRDSWDYSQEIKKENPKLLKKV